jgi:segregation and condensation protein A
MQMPMLSSRYEIHLPVFEGPLDLLLSLIEREELDITTVALARVTDQYLAQLAELEEQRVSALADFLVIAAKLLLIKSRALLPQPPSTTPEEDDVGAELVQQLQIYRRFRQIADLLGTRQAHDLHSYVRIAPLPRLDPQLDLGDVTIRDLLAAVQQALEALPAAPADEVISRIIVTVDDQIACIESHLQRRPRVTFQEVLVGLRTKLEIIVTLQALLELIKRDRVIVQQEELFGDILIRRQPNDPDVAALTGPQANPSRA